MNLAKKIILSILCVLILVMGGLTLAITRWQDSTFRKSVRHSTEVLGETICDSISTEMELGRSERVQGTLERIGRGSPQIRSLRIVNQQGDVLRSVDPEEVGKKFDLGPLQNHLGNEPALFEHRKGADPLLSFINPFFNRSQCQRCHGLEKKVNGYLVLDVSIEPMEELVSSNQRLILIGIGITFLTVVASMLFITSRWVRAPLSRVIGAMRRVEEGDLDARVNLPSGDELGRVARIFNSMVARLKENKEDLEVLHRRELERTQKMATLGELAQAIAHEIRNPIAGVSAAVKIIRDGLAKDDPRVEVFDEIHFQTGRIEKIVSNLIQFSRHTTPRFSLTDLHEIVEKTFDLFSFQLEDQRIEIKKEFHQALPMIYADPDQIQQVLMNIVLNAIQAMPRGGTLHMRTFPGGDGWVHLAVADTGKGIPEETMPKIFKPFYSTKAKGAGLGLAVVERIVQEHGGKVMVSSELQVGTTVEISLSTKPITAAQFRGDMGGVGSKVEASFSQHK